MCFERWVPMILQAFSCLLAPPDVPSSPWTLLFQSWIQPFLQSLPVPFSREWCLKGKIWVLDILFATDNVSVLQLHQWIGLKSVCVCVCVGVQHTFTSAFTHELYILKNIRLYIQTSKSNQTWQSSFSLICKSLFWHQRTWLPPPWYTYSSDQIPSVWPASHLWHPLGQTGASALPSCAGWESAVGRKFALLLCTEGDRTNVGGTGMVILP